MSDHVLCTYTVYRRLDGLPGTEFAVRQWLIRRGESKPALGWLDGAADLAAARALVPASADHRVERDPSDDPAIVETWL